MKQTPTRLIDITLSQWVGYQNTYGAELDRQRKEIDAMPEGEAKSEARQQWDCHYHINNYRHYTGATAEAVEKIGIYEVIKMQGAAFIALKKEEIQLDYRNIFTWNNEMWEIKPVYAATNKLTKEHYDIVTEIALIFSDLQDGKHEALYDLCAAYFRKVGEPFTIDLIEQRREVMKSLPLSMSLCVKKYIEESINELINI